MEKRERIRAEVLAMVDLEKKMVWGEELARDKQLLNPRLNHLVVDPEVYATWLNMRPEEEMKTPGARDMLTFEHRNEIGDAELLQQRMKGRFTYDHTVDRWYEFGGVVWKPDEIAKAAKLPMVELADMYEESANYFALEISQAKDKHEKEMAKVDKQLAEAEKAGDKDKVNELKDNKSRLLDEQRKLEKPLSANRDKLLARAKALRSNKRASSVLKVAASGSGSLGISGSEWEHHHMMFACANGVVDLETGRLLKSSPSMYLQKSSPLPYIGLNAYSNWWEDHIRKVLCGKDELIDYFETTIGASVTGTRFNKDIWVAFGPGADNGKSATFNSIKAAVGDYATTIKVDLLLDDGRDNKGPDPDMMVIDGLRMGIASEAGERTRFSIEKIKAITGGDDVRARGMYMDSKIIQSYVKLWLHTNTIPKLSGYDPGFQLRLKVIPFLAKFTQDESLVDPAGHVYRAMHQAEFAERQKSEAPYILAWVLRCARKFLANPSYRTPDIVRQFTTSYFEEEDLIGQFLHSYCTEDAEAKTQHKELYEAFKKFCTEDHGIIEKRLLSSKVFGRDLEKRYRSHQSNKKYYMGIRLLTDLELKKMESA